MTAVSAVALGLWYLPFLGLVRLARRRPALVPGRTTGPLVSIVVPARNERETIDTVLTSLRASHYAPSEILVVDDQSTDDTAERIARHAAADSRVRLVRGAPLPAGWFGKPWACCQGYRAARGDLLLFTDADTDHAPAFLGAAIDALQGAGTGAVSVITEQRCVTFWERVVMPQIWLLLGLRYAPHRVNRATRPRDTIANGQCLLVTRSAYRAAGTHEAVRREVAEDLAIAQRLLAVGHPVRLFFANGLIATRMYRNFAALWEGWSKNLALGGRRSVADTPWLARLTPILLPLPFLFWLAPFVVFPVADPAWSLGAGAGVLLFWTMVCAGLGIPLRYGLLAPLGAAMGLAVTIRSLLRGTRRVTWRGREYADVDLDGFGATTL